MLRRFVWLVAGSGRLIAKVVHSPALSGAACLERRSLVFGRRNRELFTVKNPGCDVRGRQNPGWQQREIGFELAIRESAIKKLMIETVTKFD